MESELSAMMEQEMEESFKDDDLNSCFDLDEFEMKI
jgi:hypothetical protein